MTRHELAARPVTPLMLSTPDTDHVRQERFESVYEPAEDTFILLDALEYDADLLQKRSLILEVGSGSGCVTAFLNKICGPSSFYLCTDLNKAACECTLATAERNAAAANAIRTDLVAGLCDRLRSRVDVLVFNPPYVETNDQEALDAQDGTISVGEVAKTWAGGLAGMRVTQRLLDIVNDLLAPGGLFYLVAIKQNNPEAILFDMRSKFGLEGKVVLARRAGIEYLHVLRLRKPS